ncbi:unnamed protein product [Schistosoma spindalis]|nr:unnamed protein product [Schistosoma spindale]
MEPSFSLVPNATTDNASASLRFHEQNQLHNYIPQNNPFQKLTTNTTNAHQVILTHTHTHTHTPTIKSTPSQLLPKQTRHHKHKQSSIPHYIITSIHHSPYNCTIPH